MKILVIGDACIDEYRYGTVSRLNPEAPVPVLNFTKTEERGGMAINVANNLNVFNINVEVRTPDVTSRKIRFIDSESGYHLLRVDEDAKADPYRVEPYDGYDAIVISDYNKGFITDKTILDIRDNFYGPIYLDTKKKNLADFKSIYIKINAKEYDSAISLPHPKYLLVTRGADGCDYNKENFPADQVDVRDVCGAGDTFLAALAYYHATTQDMVPAIEFANRCAAIACQHIGAYVLTKEDLRCLS